jgi:hypothetical protein
VISPEARVPDLRGWFPGDPFRQQSQLEKSRQVKDLCSTRTLKKVLGSAQSDAQWEILVIGPQKAKDGDLFRCLAGHGYRSSPLHLHNPT